MKKKKNIYIFKYKNQKKNNDKSKKHKMEKMKIL